MQFIDCIIIVYNKKDSKRVNSLKLKNVQLIVGGKTRQQSTYNALKYLINKKYLLVQKGKKNYFLITAK